MAAASLARRGDEAIPPAYGKEPQRRERRRWRAGHARLFLRHTTSSIGRALRSADGALGPQPPGHYGRSARYEAGGPSHSGGAALSDHRDGSHWPLGQGPGAQGPPGPGNAPPPGQQAVHDDEPHVAVAHLAGPPAVDHFKQQGYRRRGGSRRPSAAGAGGRRRGVGSPAV